MKRLFREEDDRYTPEGTQLENEIYGRLSVLVSNWALKGYSVRDIQLILISAVTDACLMQVLDGRQYPSHPEHIPPTED